jgi:hypothetical protein
MQKTTLFLLVALSALFGQTKTKPAAPPCHRIFDGTTLSNWIVPSFGTEGQVTVKDSCIILGTGDGCTGVTYTAPFPIMNYAVSVDAMRVDGSDFFCGMTFPVNESPCTLIIGGWGGSIIGLSSIDGQDASDNQTSTYETFENQRWYHIELRVTPDAIQAYIDGKRYIDFETTDHKLTIRREVTLSKPFGFTSWKTTASLRNICVRRL